MIYQVKVDQTVLFTGNLTDTLGYLNSGKCRYELSWLIVYGYELGEQGKQQPYHELAEGFIK